MGNRSRPKASETPMFSKRPVKALPFCDAASSLLRVPVIVHEANVIPGKAVNLLARFAAAVAVSFEESRARFPGKNCLHTGFPIRKRLMTSGAGKIVGKDLFTILVMGGSQGAHALNEIVSRAICRAWRKGVRLQVIHLAGAVDEVVVRGRYEEAGVPNAVYAFLTDMGLAYAEADFAVCRAGAATCAELSAAGVPALLVPFPFATANHQLANAKALERTGLADVIEEHALNEEWLADCIERVKSDTRKLEKMKKAVGLLAAGDAAAKIADLVEKVAGGCRNGGCGLRRESERLSR